MTALPLVPRASLLEHLLRNGIPLEHECEGTGACGTCLVVVREGLEQLAPADDDEQDLLDKTGNARPESRLACRVFPSDGDLEIVLPGIEGLPAPPPRGIVLPVTLSQRAAAYIAAQAAKRGAAPAVRLEVRPSGCSGLRYRISHADRISPRDAVFEAGGVRIVVDAQSLPFVEGTAIELAEAGLSKRLRFGNPNARQTCGCGESFAL